MLSTPLICCSSGVATDCSTLTALAPGVGGAHLDDGRRDIGILLGGQAAEGDHPDDDHKNGNDHGHDGPSDKKITHV
jgi:hypothetical protein